MSFATLAQQLPGQPQRQPIQPQRQPTQPAGPALAPPAAQPAVTPSFRFEQQHRVEINGISLPTDTRVTSTLSGHIDVLAVRSGNNNTVQLNPGLATYQMLRLSGALPVTGDAMNWFEQTRRQVAQKRSGSVIILDRSSQEVQRFNIFEAFPVGFEIDIPESSWHLTIAFEFMEQG